MSNVSDVIVLYLCSRGSNKLIFHSFVELHNIVSGGREQRVLEAVWTGGRCCGSELAPLCQCDGLRGDAAVQGAALAVQGLRDGRRGLAVLPAGSAASRRPLSIYYCT